MHGTWKVTGYGILPLAVVAVAAGAGAQIAAWLLAWLWLITGLAAAAAVVTALAVAWLMRWARARDDRDAAAWAQRRAAELPRAERLSAIPLAQRPAIAPVVNLNFYGADGEDQAARVLRGVIPGTAGDAITEGK